VGIVQNELNPLNECGCFAKQIFTVGFLARHAW
jgi:hypothetical protein